MFTKEQLKEQLKNMGIKPDDTVLIHTSFKAVGEVEGGIDGFIDIFKEYLSDGLFIIPTHTWAVVTPENPIYDVKPQFRVLVLFLRLQLFAVTVSVPCIQATLCGQQVKMRKSL